MRIALAQINTTVGAVQANVAKAIEAVERAGREGAELVVLPELTITGYPPKDLLDHPSFIDATTVRPPTLAIVGENDKNYLASADYFAAKLPDGRKVVVEGAGHPALLEQPEVVQAAVREFLDGLTL